MFVPDDPIHPGEVLREDFMAEFDVTVARVARDLGVKPDVVQDLIDENAAITAELALRLSRYFATSPEFWLNLQRSFDLAVALRTATGLDTIRPVAAA
ncbi:addiction module antidote protein, HigA family [Rhizobium sp. RU20A]|uniref:HigA family addiction module antitoxin n=1 Tax=Rhizobium sp. RU20A TaxID=1907412 RepID=UPI000955AA85|nr:HigA family addiction module antitoxin [Rhizobium sp. RU20A]SIQ10488.1 addiction module antidote protein, HigA family [Rhizobium sp. RU20A]